MGRLKKHIRPYWADVKLRSIKRSDVQKFITYLERPEHELSANTIERYYMLFKTSMKAALHAEIIDKTPCLSITLPKKGAKVDRLITHDEYDAIRRGLEETDALFADLLIGTGMRLGELVALHWQSVDLDNELINVEMSYDRTEREMKIPKDSDSRQVPLARDLVVRLAERREKMGEGQPPDVTYSGQSMRTGVVFPGLRNEDKPTDPDAFRRRFAAAVRAARTRDGGALGSVRIYDLRHTYASRLIEADVSAYRVSQLMGHSSWSTTQKYVHMRNNRFDEVREAMKPRLRVVGEG